MTQPSYPQQPNSAPAGGADNGVPVPVYDTQPVPAPVVQRPDAEQFSLLEDISEAQSDYKGNQFIPHHIVTEIFNRAFGLGWTLECRERWIDKTPFDHIYNVVLRVSLPNKHFKDHTGYESFKNHCVRSGGQKKLMRDLTQHDVIVPNIGDMWKLAWSSCVRKVGSLYGIGLAFYRNMYKNNQQNFNQFPNNQQQTYYQPGPGMTPPAPPPQQQWGGQYPPMGGYQ